MTDLFELPVEIFLHIFSYIDKGRDLASLSCVNRAFYNFATERIWGPIKDNTQKQHQIFMWACASGSTRSIRRILQGGLPIKFTYQAGYRKTLQHLDPLDYLRIPQYDFNRYQAFVSNTDTFHPPATPRTGSASSFWMPLHVAACYGQIEVVETLLEHGAQIDGPSLNYCSAEIWDFTPDAHEFSTVTKRLDTSYPPIVTKPKPTTLLHQACFESNKWHMGKLIEYGCDVNEPDKDGEQLLLHCLGIPDWQAEFDQYVHAFKFLGMHSKANMKTLTGAMEYALEEAVLPLVSFLLDDTRLDNLTLLEQMPRNPKIEPGKRWEPSYMNHTCDWDQEEPIPYPAFRFFDPRPYYLETGWWSTEQTLLDWACFHTDITPEMPNLVALLLDRGCLGPGDIASHVRALKNIACRNSHKFGVHNYAKILVNCVQKICSHLSATLPSSHEKPALPVDLFYICLEGGQCPMLDELAKTFDFTNANFSEEELWQLFQIVTYRNILYVVRRWEDRPDRRGCLETLFLVDTNNYLLRHEHTFEGLCRAFLREEGDESIIMDYLDRGGRHSFTFSTGATALHHACDRGSFPLIERLIDLGADPDKCLSSGLEFETRTEWLGDQRTCDAMPVWRLLINRGANPFRWERKDQNRWRDEKGEIKTFPGFPWDDSMVDRRITTELHPDLFREMCELATNDSGDDGDLFEVLYQACARGMYAYIKHMRTRSKARVDGIIRGKAAFFLQKLLLNLESDLTCTAYDPGTLSRMDEFIDIIQLLLELGPSDTLTSSWRFRKGRQDWTAMKLIRKLLVTPTNPHVGLQWNEECIYAETRAWRIYWCLKQRIQIGTDSAGKPKVTILRRRIEWPHNEWEPRDERCGSEEVRYCFHLMVPPWGCSCHENWP
ncbi:ankyrin [Apiospora arundinis]